MALKKDAILLRKRKRFIKSISSVLGSFFLFVFIFSFLIMYKLYPYLGCRVFFVCTPCFLLFPIYFLISSRIYNEKISLSFSEITSISDNYFTYRNRKCALKFIPGDKFDMRSISIELKGNETRAIEMPPGEACVLIMPVLSFEEYKELSKFLFFNKLRFGYQHCNSIGFISGCVIWESLSEDECEEIVSLILNCIKSKNE